MKRIIYGMSMRRKDLADWIEDHTFQVMVALAQLYLFPTGNRVHWRKEVWEKLSVMYPLKSTHKFPSADFIFEKSWEANKRYINDAMQRALDKEESYDPLPGTTYDEFYQITKDYFLWLSSMLCNCKQIPLQEVKSELDRLGLDEIDLRIQH